MRGASHSATSSSALTGSVCRVTARAVNTNHAASIQASSTKVTVSGSQAISMRGNAGPRGRGRKVCGLITAPRWGGAAGCACGWVMARLAARSEAHSRPA